MDPEQCFLWLGFSVPSQKSKPNEVTDLLQLRETANKVWVVRIGFWFRLWTLFCFLRKGTPFRLANDELFTQFNPTTIRDVYTYRIPRPDGKESCCHSRLQSSKVHFFLFNLHNSHAIFFFVENSNSRSLLAEVSHEEAKWEDGETSAGFWRVVWWSRRPDFWSKLTGF